MGMKCWQRNCWSQIPGREIVGLKFKAEIINKQTKNWRQKWEERNSGRKIWERNCGSEIYWRIKKMVRH